MRISGRLSLTAFVVLAAIVGGFVWRKPTNAPSTTTAVTAPTSEATDPVDDAPAPVATTTHHAGFGSRATPPSTSQTTPRRARNAEPAKLKVTITEVARAEVGALVEDGTGSRVAPSRPALIDVEADHAWFAGARDPVLRAGDRRLTSYSFPSPKVLRFVIADVSVIHADDATFTVGYGDNAPVVASKGSRP